MRTLPVGLKEACSRACTLFLFASSASCTLVLAQVQTGESALNHADQPVAVRVVVASTTVQVQEPDNGITELAEPKAFHASAAEILASAGTYGDVSRFLQLFPGVVFNSDKSNDILVRGGNPIENLYLVDGFEIPNINHISIQASTGGLVSMIDTAAIGNVELHTGGYGAKYEERLSSVIDIRTREMAGNRRHAEADAGIVGAGGLFDISVGSHGSFLLSAHRSLLNLVTNDIGLNGAPIYTNLLARMRLQPTSKDQFTLLSLTGDDSLDMDPCAADTWETNTIDTQYRGWRTTSGLQWQRLYSAEAFGTITVSDSEQRNTISQQDQSLNPLYNRPTKFLCHLPNSPSVYEERTHDGNTDLRYDYHHETAAKFSVVAGVLGRLRRVNYYVDQPRGEQSSLSLDSSRSDSTNFLAKLHTGESAAYAEASWHASQHWTMSAGGRLQIFALGEQRSITPRFGTRYEITSHTSIHANYGQYAQMPPAIYMLAYPQNRKLTLIQARHLVAGVDLWEDPRGRLSLDMYRKDYRNYPVSTEYPSLSLANMVDTLGQQFLWLPLTSQGRGVAEGIEIFGAKHFGNYLFGQANAAYSRTRFSGLDGVLRPGNFDYPVVANATGTWRSQAGYEASFRYEYSFGRPFTPFALAPSLAQNRPIYDLGAVNAVRGPVYSRLDFQVDRSLHIRQNTAILYAGLENVFDRKNFLGYTWMPHCETPGWKPCDAPYTEQSQMGRFPNFGMRYLF
jgi:hypothetical protein